MTTIEDRLSLVRYVVDQEAHIAVDGGCCEKCATRLCLLCCPAGCFTVEDGAVRYAYQGCLECGTCQLLCPGKAIDWHYPRGGYGVSYRF